VFGGSTAKKGDSPMAVKKKVVKKTPPKATDKKTAPKPKPKPKPKASASKKTGKADKKELTMPQRSSASLVGGARPVSASITVGAKVVCPAGLGVQSAWCAIFDANEKRGVKTRLTDAEITEVLGAAFPKRNSAVFSRVQGVRRQYNEGAFTATNGVPDVLSNRYDDDGNVTTARGKALEVQPARTAKKTPPKRKSK
jgi:hypothetical protein